MMMGGKRGLRSEGRMLVSYGEFFVKATQNNQDLLVKKDSAVKVQIPAKPVNGQEIPMWGGDSAATFTLTGYDYLNTAVTIAVQQPVRGGISWKQLTTSSAFFNSSNGTIDISLASLATWRHSDAIR